MAKKKTKKKTSKKPAGFKVTAEDAAEVRSVAKYTVRAVCADCGARTLKCLNSPVTPQRGDELPTSCDRPKGLDERCCGTLTVRNIFNKEV